MGCSMGSPSNEQREIDGGWYDVKPKRPPYAGGVKSVGPSVLTCHVCGKPLGNIIETVRPVPTASDPHPPYFAPCCVGCKP